MKLIGIGLDMIEVERIKMSWQRFGDRFLKRIFSEGERNYCFNKSKPELHLAARFAAKEAVSKAIGSGIGQKLHWQDLDIQSQPNGRPLVILSSQAKKTLHVLGANEVWVSLTHTRQFAAAQAALIYNPQSPSINITSE